MAQLQSKLKRGDSVVVLTGKDKGQRGTIERVITKTNRVVVSGINTVNRHVGQREAMRTQGQPGKVQKEMPIHVSNVALVDPKEDKATRIGYQTNDKGEKVRVAKKSGETIDTLKKAAGSKPAAKKAPAKKAPAKKTKEESAE